MKRVAYFRGGKINEAIEVTKEELKTIKEKCKYVSISSKDENNLKNVNDNEIAGAIFGDIENIFKDIVKEDYDVGVVKNPDCWFVNKDFISKNYKNLETDKFTFGDAIELLKLGFKVAREGWNGKGMFLFLFDFNNRSNGFRIELFSILDSIIRGEVSQLDLGYYDVDPVICMKTAKDTIQFGWLASQADILAEDWVVLF